LATLGAIPGFAASPSKPGWLSKTDPNYVHTPPTLSVRVAAPA
jgi:hypothetical protein